jgi:hypothetical protein
LLRFSRTERLIFVIFFIIFVMQVMIRVMLLLLLLPPHLILFFTPLFAPFSPAIFEPNLREKEK